MVSPPHRYTIHHRALYQTHRRNTLSFFSHFSYSSTAYKPPNILYHKVITFSITKCNSAGLFHELPQKRRHTVSMKEGMRPLLSRMPSIRIRTQDQLKKRKNPPIHQRILMQFTIISLGVPLVKGFLKNI